MIKAELQGRRLILTVETADDETTIEPFRVDPLSGTIGRQLTLNYALAMIGMAPEGYVLGDDLVLAIGRENFARIDDELRQEEAESIMYAAFYWQTNIGMDGVRAVLEGGVEGQKKAAGLLAARMAPLLSPTVLSTASGSPTSSDGTPATSTPPAGKLPVKRPADHKSKAPKRPKAAPNSAPPTSLS